jgi:crotonobetainyl-CoA:carnitine CoA-transferase CaiB-like acyl-CoA transferase
MNGPLEGLTVLDLSRVMAGPTCTQLFGDMGARVIKIENPRTGGDDTRSWGPPWMTDADGNKSDLSAYFMSANRNKLSVAVDISSTEGRAQIDRLAAQADILVENFKPGGLTKYGLDYAALGPRHQHLIYCSISGYGQTGPNAPKPGYDLMAQGYGGIMSLTGDPDGEPVKVGVAIADVMTGMYAASGILAALHHRTKTGEGQHIDIALVDAQMAWLINEGTNYLNSGQLPTRRGNAHANISPYQVFAASDGHVIIAVGNDGQFRNFCQVLQRPDLAQDNRFATNPARVDNRADLIAALAPLIAAWTIDDLISACATAMVPAGPVNTLDRALNSDQAAAREMVIEMPSPADPSQTLRLLGNPLKFSRTPVSYRHAPPVFGQDTDEVLREE